MIKKNYPSPAHPVCVSLRHPPAFALCVSQHRHLFTSSPIVLSLSGIMNKQNKDISDILTGGNILRSWTCFIGGLQGEVVKWLHGVAEQVL